VRAFAASVVVAAGCGPVLPASDRVPLSGGQSTTQGDEGTHPGSDAPVHADDDTAGDEPKYDIDDSFGEDTRGGCPRMFEVDPLSSAVEVIVDVSQTMAQVYVDDDQLPQTEPITRWRMLSTALADWLPALAETAQLDLQMFPGPDSPAPPSLNACETWIGPGLGTPVDDLLAALPPPEATFMQGANPTDRAISNAQSMLQRVDDRSKRSILLLTDGAPNCFEVAQPPELFDQVNDAARGWAEYAFALGIPTYVVAIAVPEGEYGGSQGDPFANHLQVLEGIAYAGGNVPLYANTKAQLDDALAYVVAQTRSCRARLPDELAGKWFHVDVGGQIFYEIGFATCFGDAGFVYVDNNPLDTIELCGAACDLFVAQGHANLVEECSFPE
jgi:hypothetical protein